VSALKRAAPILNDVPDQLNEIQPFPTHLDLALGDA
jgi:hypothetical protein